MNWLNLSEISTMSGGALHGEDQPVNGIAIDTRNLNAGDLFIALKGERFDGHDFVAESGVCGAVAAMVEREINVTLPQIVVKNTIDGLTNLASSWRRHCSAVVVALTGSNGKTTTKTLLASVLEKKFNVLSTRGNLNNHIGVPLTLLALREQHQVAVLELGANHPGEISQLSKLVKPTVALILNAAPAHLTGFSSVDGVARAKGELFEYLVDGGIAVLNGDDPYYEYWLSLLKGYQVVTFGIECADDSNIDVKGWVSSDKFSDAFEIEIERRRQHLHLALSGKHNLSNALATAAVAHGLGISFDDIVAGLEAVKPMPGRLCELAGLFGTRVIDDSYNANPSSLVAALKVLGKYQGERWLVLGDMAELGAEAQRLHAESGCIARQYGVCRLFALGEMSRQAADSFGEGGECFDSCEDLIEHLGSQLLAKNSESLTILIKGSRSARMERVVQALEAPHGETKC